ncbi:uncharacterized protein LOC120010476 [Tripterygium wilfordii]|uniref:uncharacterized protein LOC120010476 n=1 Tax=Tripterygium wilfordii TaxID=458696 RepID=UPI0018F81381|nr:uncharacterized protein LOC120010476 [Tripterygium wilfordii]
MDTKSSSGNVISCVLTLTVIFLAIYAAAAKEGPYEYMKISLRWPKSYCNTKEILIRHIHCYKPILKYFTIHGFWPTYTPDTTVPSFLKNSGCTNATPKMPDAITQICISVMYQSM